ncbi:MFS transporter [Sporolactobacillus terrae]|uniref:MFS transporter n=1 Tax=Sporolactobacillus terrae TaxID=269673 RepID=A0ABX5Q9W1_9BACL|nr:MFS transporter [Sporolactobacillus terrae]QAA23458.1 MFS transporter [Sporolactobacillus terrae]QAA26428.1 MFS transporter [Sporolactobacillus terrae]UAK15522.1 MFS transporter [Sporolactobacillus terrae]
MPQNQLIKKQKYPEFFRPLAVSKAFRSLWIGNALSTFGSAITNVILPLFVYELTDSPMAMGTIMAAYMIPVVLILPVSGVIVDRFNRIRIMQIADLIRFLLMMGLMTLGTFGRLSLPVLIVIIAGMGLMNGLFQPAFAAMRARIFVSDIRNAANALNQFSEQLLRLIGPSIGGLIVSFASATLGFGIDACTFFLSFLCLMFLVQEGSVEKRKSRKETFVHECFAGIQVIKKNTWLWVTIVFFSFANICLSGMITVLVPWLIKVHAHLPNYMYGLTMSGAAFGSIAAAFFFGMRKQWRHRGMIGYSGILIAGLALWLMPYAHHSFLFVLLMIVEGAGVMIFGLIWETSMQELVSPEVFGRVASIDMVGSFALLPLGYLMTGWLAGVLGGIGAITIMSSVSVGAAALILFAPAIRNFD